MIPLSLGRAHVVTSLAFTPDGQSLIVGNTKGEVLRLNLFANHGPWAIPVRWFDSATHLDFHFDQQSPVVYITQDGGTELFSTVDWSRQLLSWSNASCNRIVPHPTKPIWATIASGFLTVRHSQSRYYQIWEPKLGHHRVDCVQFSPDGNQLAVVGSVYKERIKGSYEEERTLILYDAQEGRMLYSTVPTIHRFHLPRDEERGRYDHSRVRWSHDGRWLAVGDCESVLIFPAGGTLASSQPRDGTVTRDFAFHPQSHYLYVATTSGTVEVWSPPTWESVRSFDWNIGPLTAIAISQDGALAAVAGADGQLVVWDVDE